MMRGFLVFRSIVRAGGLSAALLASAADFDVLTFGAVGDGLAKDTVAIQRAVDAAERAGGGRVTVPAGTYVSGSIFLKDNVDLHLEAGATLKGSPDRSDYNRTDVCPQNWGSEHECHTGGHLLLAIEKKNVRISGLGRIDGNGPVFLADRDGQNHFIDPEVWNLNIPWRPAQMLYFVECEEVRVDGVSLVDSPYWSCFFHGCTNVRVQGVRIRNRRFPLHAHNGDGIDIDCCCDVEVSDCDIDSSDDCLTFRSGASRLHTPRPCEDIRVRRCRLSTPCNALRFGVGKGLVRRVSVRDVEIWDTRTAINFVSGWNDDSVVDFEDVEIENVRLEARSLCRIYPGRSRTGKLRNVRIAHVRGTAPEDAVICSLPSHSFRDVTFEDVDIDGRLLTFGVENLRLENSGMRRKELPEAELSAILRMAREESKYPGALDIGGTRRGTLFLGGRVTMPSDPKIVCTNARTVAGIAAAVLQGAEKVVLDVRLGPNGFVLAPEGSETLSAALDVIPDGDVWIDLCCPDKRETIESLARVIRSRGRLHQTHLCAGKRMIDLTQTRKD